MALQVDTLFAEVLYTADATLQMRVDTLFAEVVYTNDATRRMQVDTIFAEALYTLAGGGVQGPGGGIRLKSRIDFTGRYKANPVAVAKGVMTP